MGINFIWLLGDGQFANLPLWLKTLIMGFALSLLIGTSIYCYKNW